MRARLLRATHDGLHVLDLAVVVEDMADRHEQRALVDRLQDLRVGLAHDDLEVRLRLVDVAHGREVRTLVHDPVSRGVDRPEARKHDRLRDRDVLLHDRRARRRADDASDLVADPPRRLPPALRPRADPALGPHARELLQPLLRPARHRPERVAHEVGRVLEDRELRPVLEEVAHGQESAGQREAAARCGQVGRRPAQSPTDERGRADQAEHGQEERAVVPDLFTRRVHGLQRDHEDGRPDRDAARARQRRPRGCPAEAPDRDARRRRSRRGPAGTPRGSGGSSRRRRARTRAPRRTRT